MYLYKLDINKRILTHTHTHTKFSSFFNKFHIWIITPILYYFSVISWHINSHFFRITDCCFKCVTCVTHAYVCVYVRVKIDKICANLSVFPYTYFPIFHGTCACMYVRICMYVQYKIRVYTTFLNTI